MRHTSTFLGLLVAATMIVNAASDARQCQPVEGKANSTIVPQFSNGDLCASPIGLCTEGRFTGAMNGPFVFTASSVTPIAALDPEAPPDMATVTGVLTATPNGLCDGTVTFADTSVFSLSADGSFCTVFTVTGSTGGCQGLTGRVRMQGLFVGGCVDCRYEGQVCRVAPSAE